MRLKDCVINCNFKDGRIILFVSLKNTRGAGNTTIKLVLKSFKQNKTVREKI